MNTKCPELAFIIRLHICWILEYFLIIARVTFQDNCNTDEKINKGQYKLSINIINNNLRNTVTEPFINVSSAIICTPSKNLKYNLLEKDFAFFTTIKATKNLTPPAKAIFSGRIVY